MQCGLFLSALAAVWMVSGIAEGQRFVVQNRMTTSGEIGAISGDELTLVDADSKISVFKVQRRGQRSIEIDGGLLNSPATIKAVGELDAKGFLRPAMVVKFSASLRKGGRSEGKISNLTLVTADDFSDDVASGWSGKITELSSPGDSKYASCEVVGVVKQISKGRLTVVAGKSPYAAKGRVRVLLADDAVVAVQRNDLNLVQAGDRVPSLSVVQLKTGAQIVDAIEVEVKQPRSDAIMDWIENDIRYSLLSDAPAKVRDVRSRHFLLHTDISDRQGQQLLDKLETMIDLVSNYYRRPSRGLIECYVVRDIENWPAETFPPPALIKIQEPAGVTITRSLGNQIRTIAFCCDNHKVVQHEAIHAYCQQVFGSTGPVWYSEGMAEMGAYWKQGQLEVDIYPGVIRYLTKAKPKKMLDIVAAGQVTGDSWQAYAWRWALCHLLANNKNYSPRFKGLGIAMMLGKKASFEATYGDVAELISFEYDQFVKNFGNGYRADLTAWQWGVKAKRLTSKPITQIVKSQRGWQSTAVQVEAGKSYTVAAEGTWQITAAGEALSADGNGSNSGRDKIPSDGKLIGAIFRDFELSESFELGAKSIWVAPADGQLVLRCRDAWTKLSENSGEMKVTIAKEQQP